ncbi:MAG TPA: metal ABC transporter permease, partial [Solirubrobacteraceae bacterium]|nr:metal ABC transporter permease [Solirubrobacteraceae bacterium]
MLSQEFMRNALLAGTFVALACGVIGWFVVLRGQVFAGDALSHVAFPGALAAASAGVDERIGLFAATV